MTNEAASSEVDGSGRTESGLHPGHPSVEADCIARLVARASVAYGPAGRFAERFARGKLSRDPLFATLLRIGALPDASCVVDLGCGQGLLALWLHVAHAAWRARSLEPWPSHWPAPPKVGTYLGVDRSRSDIGRARRAMPSNGRVFRGDLRTVGMRMLDRCDVVTLFDVLQYLDCAAQEKLFDAIAAALPPWGVMVLRVGDNVPRAADAVDLLVCACRGYPRWRLHRRPLATWIGLLEARGFAVEVLEDASLTAARRRRSASSNVLLRASRLTATATRASTGEALR